MAAKSWQDSHSPQTLWSKPTASALVLSSVRDPSPFISILKYTVWPSFINNPVVWKCEIMIFLNLLIFPLSLLPSLEVKRINPRALHLLGKCSTSELYPKSLEFEIGSHGVPRLILNLWSSCCSPCSYSLSSVLIGKANHSGQRLCTCCLFIAQANTCSAVPEESRASHPLPFSTTVIDFP